MPVSGLESGFGEVEISIIKFEYYIFEKRLCS